MNLCKIAKDRKIATIFVGHSTKGGYIAGLQTFQHMVDVILYVGLNEDNTRFIQAHKNRFEGTRTTDPLYMNAFGLLDNPNVDKPFGELNKTVTYTTSQIIQKVEGHWIKPLALMSITWLREQVGKQNEDVTLTPKQMEELLEGHPVWKPIVNKTLSWLEKN